MWIQNDIVEVFDDDDGGVNNSDDVKSFNVKCTTEQNVKLEKWSRQEHNKKEWRKQCETIVWIEERTTILLRLRPCIFYSKKKITATEKLCIFWFLRCIRTAKFCRLFTGIFHRRFSSQISTCIDKVTQHFLVLYAFRSVYFLC